MNSTDLQKITQPDVQKFIREHESDDTRELVLKHSSLFELPSSVIADQINGRKKAKEKIPLYYHTAGIIFPPSINLEQCSSQHTAEYKLKFIREQHIPTNCAVDLTGGFGIDSLFLSKQFESVEVVEQDQNLLSLAQHNHEVLNATNIKYYCEEASDFISGSASQYNLAYIDPSRRAVGNQKVFKLSDCSPNVAQWQEEIFRKCEFLLIKTSPLLDIEAGLRELHFVKTVVVVSVENECKEVLFLSQRNHQSEPEIVAINLKEEAETFMFTVAKEKTATISLADPLEYLYEPNASILKAGAFKSIAAKYGVAKIHSSTHLYTHDNLIADFPGRIFKIEAHVKSDPQAILPYFPNEKGNVSTRNYPLAADQLKKKSGLKDGGEKYLLGFSGQHKKFLVVANRLK